jgi:pyridoxine 4-dehydrogenase
MCLMGEGIWGPPKDRKAALAVLRRAVDLGVNFIGTADSYGPYVNKNAKTSGRKPHVAERSGVTDKKRGKRRL